jgi:DNA-binding NarL/FixJ family response regulator
MTIRESPTFRRHRILIVDDHPLVRRGLRDLIAAEPDLEVCGEADDPPEALRQIASAAPDLAVVDLSLKSGHGIDLVKEIRARGAGTRILVSSMHDESLFAERCLRAGAMGYINKQEPPEKVIAAIRQVLRGELYLSTRMTTRILKHVGGVETFNDDPVNSLSDRELEVFEMIGHGQSTKQISRRLELSQKTIETYRENIKKKLNLANSSELSSRATQWIIEKG